MVYLIEMSCRLLFVRRVDVTAERGQRGGLGLGCCGTARAAAQADRPTYKLCPGGRRILSRRPQPRHRRITHSRSAEAVGQGGTVPHAALACLPGSAAARATGTAWTLRLDGRVDRRRGCDIDRVAGLIALHSVNTADSSQAERHVACPQPRLKRI